jgi:murein L,D-transpeptidase YcbB/YkuD
MKKLLIISLIFLGLTGVVLAQEASRFQPASPTPLLPSLTSKPLDIPDVDSRVGERGVHVKKIQEILKELGFLPADFETTEYFGPKTREAIMNFQKAKGLPATGFFGPITRNALRGHFSSDKKEVIDRNVDINCMRTAVEKRENAILAAYDTFTQKIRNAHQTRKTELLAAWSLQDPKQRHDALKSAWEKYRNSVKEAQKEWQQNRRTIWVNFVQEAKNCRPLAVETPELENVEVPKE